MSVKNAFKILINRFGLVFSIFVFVSVVGVLIIALSMAFLPPIISLLNEAGLAEVYEKLLLGNLSPRNIYDGMNEMLDIIREVFSTSTKFKVNTALLVVVVLGFCYRLLLGYYELPAIDAIEAKMSSNARIGFMNRFIANFGLSTKFIFAKMLYTVTADILIGLIMYGVFSLWGINGALNWFLPFLWITLYVLLQSLRYSAIALWSPSVAENKGKIFASFKYSCRSMSKNFAHFYGCFLITWILIFAINTLMAITTYCAGLLFTVPLSMAFICALNLVLYFKTKNRKYYLDDDKLST